MSNYKAYVVTEKADGNFTREFQIRTIPEVIENQVLIKVAYSSINYKDYLSSMGNKGVTRNYPHVPGIDLAGTIEKSNSAALEVGQKVLVTGYDLGMNTDGGWGEYAVVPGEWVVPLPEKLSLKESMVWGTAGFTAAQLVEALEKYQDSTTAPSEQEIIVSGASGGVGTMAVKILAHLGYQVTALTRSQTNDDFLKIVGASRTITLTEWEESLNPKKPLEKSIWDGAIDTVGGATLGNILKCIKYRGVVSCCGMVAGANLNTTVFPFILRGLKLIGIDSAEQPLMVKKALWNKIVNEWEITDIEDLYQEIAFNQLSENILKMEKGEICGRIVVKIQ